MSFRVPTALLTVFLLGGCGETDVDGDSETSEESSGVTDLDASTDAGSGADAGAAGGGASADYDGVYVGEIIVIGSAEGYDGTSQACFGELELLVDALEDPTIQGMATCSFDGWLEGMGEQVLHLTGQTKGNDSASGIISVDVEGNVYEDDWGGTWDEHGLTGSFSGQTTWSVGAADYDIRFEGSFSVWPE